MNQPELGKLISEIRNQKGITQKQLSESCNIDIRTVQRIECGEVVPRHSTLKLIAEFLEYDFQQSNGNELRKYNISKDLFLFIFISGIIYTIKWFISLPIIPILNLPIIERFFLILAIIYMLTSFFFFYGFYLLGISYGSKLLQITSIVIMILAPIYVIVDIFPDSAIINYLSILIVALLGINGILYGISLLLLKRYNKNNTILYQVAGLLQIFVNPLFILPVPLLNYLGLWIALPSVICLLFIIYFEYSKSRQFFS